MTEAAPRRRRALVALVFLGVFNAVLFAARSWPALYDTDSTYHLAAAREYARHGMLHTLRWARFSALADGFGDKELLFHLALVPFSLLPDPVAGGKIALALLNGAIAATLASFAIRAVGVWGALVPLWVFGTACDFTLRTLRLRPESVALLLFLAATAAAARRSWRALFAIAFLFALSYTAVHALLGLCALFFVYAWWVERRPEWPVVAAPALGIALGLLAHPQLPANLRVFWLQTVTFLEMKSRLDVGTEILPPTTYNALVLNFGWVLGIAILLACRRPRAERGEEPAGTPRRRLADFVLIGALVFLGLFLAAMRFATYLVPFATLAVLLRIGLDGGLGARMRLPWRGGVPARLALAAPLLAIPYAWHLDVLNLRNSGVLEPSRPANDAAMGRALPEGAKVAAPWNNAEAYVLAAPQARYLNVLDPVFMASPFPEIYAAQRALFDGDDRDPVLTAATRLDSDWIAFGLGPSHALLEARLAADPRAERVHAALDALYRLRPDANPAFVLDWRVAPQETTAPPPRGASVTWPALPRETGARARAFEGYVDATRVKAEGCLTLVHEIASPASSLATYELAASGPTTLFLDGAWIASAPESEAIPGRGVTFPLRLEAGVHELAAGACPARNGTRGFYLIERASAAKSP